MAKVLSPLNSAEARGAVGGLTYNTWRGIHTVKTRSGPVTQYSDAQVAIRLKTKLATLSWQSLTDAQRAPWFEYANTHTDIDWTGKPQRITAYNWYVRVNVRRQLWGSTVNPAVPTMDLTVTLENLHAITAEGITYIGWEIDGRPERGDCVNELYLVGPHSAGASPNIKAAHRDGQAPWDEEYVQTSCVLAGWYTAWLRSIHVQGVVSIFRLLRFYHPVP